MSRLVQWLDHRMEVVGIEKEKDISEPTGIAVSTLREMREIGSLAILNRTQKRSLAIVLRVSLRKLEQLDEGAIDWIDDHDIYDIDGYRRPFPAQADDPAYWAPQEPPPQERGTPLIGRIRPTGKAELDEDWHLEWGKHIPLRFGKGQKVFALEIEPTGGAVVLQVIAPWEFGGGKAAVYCWNGWDAEAWFGRVSLQPKTYVVTADGQRHDLDLLNVMRIGKVIGRWPKETEEPAAV